MNANDFKYSCRISDDKSVEINKDIIKSDNALFKTTCNIKSNLSKRFANTTIVIKEK